MSAAARGHPEPPVAGERAPVPRHRRLSTAVPLALTGGAVAALAFPPSGVPGAAVLGAAAGLWTMHWAPTAAQGALRGLAWGAGFGALLFRWALALDPVAYAALVPSQAAYWAVTGALVARLGRGRGHVAWVLVATAVWTLVEFVRGRWPLGGFEWGQLGLASAGLPVRQAAAVVGALGVTALWVAVAAALVVLLIEHRRGWRPLAAGLAAAAALTAVGALPWTSPSGTLEVAVVQVDDPCPGRFAVDCPDFRRLLLERHAQGTAALDRAPELLLWGEGVLRAETADEAGAMAARALDGLPSPLLAGVANPAGPGRFQQRNVLFDRTGDVRDVYDKRHPVPFGEFVPFRELLGGIADVGRYVPTDLVAGEEPVALRVPVDGGTVDLGTVVSWEVAFAREVRSAARLGSAVATLTTQASYGPGQPVSDQLLRAAQLRAVEAGKAMVVAATTGRSALISPDGRLVDTTALFAAGSLTGTLPLRDGLTPYAWWGDAPVVLLALVTVATVAGPWRQRDSRPRGRSVGSP